MFEAEFLIFCAGKSSDTRNNISLHGIFDRLYMSSFPGRHTPFLAIAKIRAKKAAIDAQIKVKIVTELANEEIGKQELSIPVTIEKDNGFGFDIDYSNFVFPKAGKYFIKLYLDDKLVVTRMLDVRSADELTEK
jgi:hypothetical protein